MGESLFKRVPRDIALEILGLLQKKELLALRLTSQYFRKLLLCRLVFTVKNSDDYKYANALKILKPEWV